MSRDFSIFLSPPFQLHIVKIQTTMWQTALGPRLTKLASSKLN